MAETYRGLTIRIGGDATSLQKALRSVNSSIASTETQLRKMRQALNMDPGNMEAIETNLRLVGQRAVEAQTKLSELKRAVQEVGSQKVDLLGGSKSTQTVRELADATEDAASRAATAKQNYAEVCDQLAQVKGRIQELTGIDLDQELNPDETVQTMRELDMISDDLADDYARLRASYEEAFNENEVAKAVEQMRDLETETTKAEAQANQLASRFSELSRAASGLDLGGDIEQRLRQVDSAAESVNEELQRLDRALDMDPGNVDAIAAKMRDLSEASSLSEEKVRLLEQRLDAMDAAGVGKLSDETSNLAITAQEASDEYDRASEAVVQLKGHLSDLRNQQSLLSAKGEGLGDEYIELGEQIQRAESELDGLIATQQQAKAAFESSSQVQEYRDLQTEIAETRAEQSRLNDELTEMSTFSGATSSALTSLGMSLSTTVTPAILAMGSSMVDSTYDIDSAYRDMRKTVNGTEQQFEDLRQAAIDFSTTHVTSADQILSIQAIGGELGIATEDLQVFAETVSNLDIATNLDADEAATSLGQLSNILDDLTADKFPSFSDALVRLGNNGASTESQISDIATRIGSMASIVGMSTPEILAWSSTIASTGQGAEAAGTAISNTISDIEQAVAKGGDSLEAFASVAQMSAEDFAESWESAPSETLQAFIEGLNQIEEDGGSAVTTLSDLGITSTRQVQAIQGLMQMIGGLNDNLEMSEDAWNGVSDEWGEAGDAANEAEAKAEGFSGAMDILSNSAQVLGAELGDSLVPVINGVADAIGDLASWFSELPDEVKQGVAAVGAFAAALGPMILLKNGISGFFGEMSKGLKSLSSVKKAAKNLAGLGDAAQGASAASSALGGALVTVGIAVAGIALQQLISHFQEEAERAEQAQRATEGLAEAVKMADASMAEGADSSEEWADNLDSVVEAAHSSTEKLAELADSFDQINVEAAGQIAALDSAKSAIDEYSGASDLTAEQVGKLKSAIALLNDSCGTNYEVVRESDGAYKVYQDGVEATIEDIDKLIEKQKQQIREQAQLQKLSDLYESQAEFSSQYNEAYGNYVDAQNAMADAAKKFQDRFGMDVGDIGKSGTATEIQQRSTSDEYKAYIEARDAVIEYGEAVDELGTSLDSTLDGIDDVESSLGNMEKAAEGAYEGFDQLVMKSTMLNDALGGDEDVMLDFSQALQDSGADLDYFSTLSEKQLSNLAIQWQKSGGDMAYAMEQVGIHTTQAAADVQTALQGFSDGAVAEALENAGVNIYQLSDAMADAGISAQTLNEIGSANFTALANNCGGDIDRLIFMLQNYNGQPIYDKDGNITVNEAQLIDAQGNVYTWNGTQLLDKSGNVVMHVSQLTDANGDIARWNESGQLVDKNGNVYVEDSQLTDAQGNVYTWNGTQLHDQEGNVYVNETQLTDCLGNMVEWNGTKLNKIEGTVYCDYDELTSALSSIEQLKNQSGYTATVHVNTVRTTTYRTVNESGSSGSARSTLAAPATGASGFAAATVTPMALSAADAGGASPLARAATNGATSAVRALASNPSLFSEISSSAVRQSKAARVIEVKASDAMGRNGVYIENQNFETRVVRADEDLYSVAPIIYRNATREARLISQ